MEKTLNKKLLLELSLATIILLLVTSLLNAFQFIFFIGRYYGFIFALLFLYVPFFLLQRRKEKIDFLDKNVKGYLKSFFVFIVVSIVVFPLFAAAAHFWMKCVFQTNGPHFGPMPDVLNVTLHQLLMVALPEEFFFRGYMQSTFDKIFAKRWRLLGVRLGWGWIITALIFAFSHSVITLQWWHFSIFFPALLFGYLRERTGTITAPILFHAASNLVNAYIFHIYY